VAIAAMSGPSSNLAGDVIERYVHACIDQAPRKEW
jgi:hypothetical protein